MREINFVHALQSVQAACGITNDEWDELNNCGITLMDKLNSMPNRGFSMIIEESIKQKRLMLHEDYGAPITINEVLECMFFINTGLCMNKQYD